MNNIFSRCGSSDSSTLPSFIWEPAPWADHSALLESVPENRQANRTGASLPGRFGDASSPQTFIDSIHGNAMLTPRPRNIARRVKR
ncbi:MAG: hypothetical protein CM1200mP2_51480 [Planctomycetaceae bacterium]|nr:MAG: hypothetical protein CM1200mP2_51480 [Planctomycetaceae bacterium]